MECLLAAIFIFIILSIPLTAVGLSIWPSQGEEALKQVARRFSGSYFRGSWFRPARVSFRYGAAAGLLHVNHNSGRTFLELSLHGTRPNMRVEVAPLNFPGGRLLEQDSRIRAVYSLALDPAQTYNVYAESELTAQRFLLDAVVMQLRILQRFQDSAPLMVTIDLAEMTISKQWMNGLRQADPIVEFINISLRLHDHLLLGKEKGIEFVPAQPGIEHSKCAICGEAIEEHYVACRQCSAPHHLECWKYNGACGMYACKETKYDTLPKRSRQTPWQ